MFLSSGAPDRAPALMFGRRSNIRRDVALTLTQIPSRSVPASFGSPGPPRPVAPALAMRRSSGGRFAVALVSATLACLAASARAEVYLPGLISSHAGETKPRHNHHPRSRNDDNPVRNIEGDVLKRPPLAPPPPAPPPASPPPADASRSAAGTTAGGEENQEALGSENQEALGSQPSSSPSSSSSSSSSFFVFLFLLVLCFSICF